MDRRLDWLNQADADLKAAKELYNNNIFNWSCFLSQQAAEKALKSLYEKLNIPVWGHDLNIPKKIENACNVLNLYYISTRYPDAFVSGYPALKFGNSQSEDAIKLAQEVIDFVKKNI